ncbi:MAG: sugar phosphate isomerase/epimerase [Clostridia bacterium]|nr:sugar phosphate isomerase/epimerase [Clostridia bacterium]
MKLCIQSENLVERFGIENAYRMIKEAGFEAIDWNLDKAWKFKVVTAASELKDLCVFEKSLPEILEHYEEELSHIRQNGLVISQAHAPFGAYVPYREDVLDYAISIYQSMIRFCSAVGCPRLIIHGISMVEGEPDMTLERYEMLNMRLYGSLIPVLQEVGNVTVCLENLFSGPKRLGADYWEGVCSNPYEAATWVDRLNEQAGQTCFGFCLDTGHVNLLRKSLRTFIPILGNRIIALHIHDNDQKADSHLMPYAGSIFWEDFLNELKRIGYAGDLSFETFAQYSGKRLPAPLVPVFLDTIHKIGDYFRNELQTK